MTELQRSFLDTCRHVLCAATVSVVLTAIAWVIERDIVSGLKALVPGSEEDGEKTGDWVESGIGTFFVVACWLLFTVFVWIPPVEHAGEYMRLRRKGEKGSYEMYGTVRSEDIVDERLNGYEERLRQYQSEEYARIEMVRDMYRFRERDA